MTDKSQLALTEEAKDQLSEITDKYRFRDRQDAYRLAVALALAEKLPPAPTGASRTTYINIGGLDPEGSLRSAVSAIRDGHGDLPVSFIELLAESGIARIHEHAESGKPLRELLEPYVPETD